MTASTDYSAAPALIPQTTTTHFWVASYPFFESTLFVLAPSATDQQGELSSSIRIYDPDGAEINEISVGFRGAGVGVFELEQFLEACKLESGLKHAHVVVTSPFATRHWCRIHTRQGAAMLGEPVTVCDSEGAFFPITFARDRACLLCFVNYGEETARVRCRLFCGKRTPETFVAVPRLGARILVLQAQFPEFASIDEGRQLQAYVRLSTQEGQSVGVQLVENLNASKDGGVFSAVG